MHRPYLAQLTLGRMYTLALDRISDAAAHSQNSQQYASKQDSYDALPI